MKLISVDELTKYKVLPFDIFNSDGNLVFAEGEPLDPERMAFLRNLPLIFRDEDANDNSAPDVVFSEQFEALKKRINNRKIVETCDFQRSETRKPTSFIDYINMKNYSGPVNSASKIDFSTQIKMKAVLVNALDIFNEGEVDQAFELFNELKVKIVGEVSLILKEVHKCSELIFLGEYEYCHMLNTATFAAILALKLGYSKDKTFEVTMAALLHDIGKYRVTQRQAMTEHVILGYNIVKNEFKLSEEIAQAVLKHHENVDGSGYPNKLSSELITAPANIINMCSTFDNLVFNRTPAKINTPREALRELMNIGTAVFLPDVFYTFIHMFSYNDIIRFEDLVLDS